jgi:hypothetical protein
MLPYQVLQANDGLWYFEDLNETYPHLRLHGPFDTKDQAEVAAVHWLQHG